MLRTSESMSKESKEATTQQTRTEPTEALLSVYASPRARGWRVDVAIPSLLHNPSQKEEEGEEDSVGRWAFNSAEVIDVVRRGENE